MPEFDPHASIKQLAEAELECQRRWTDSITNQWQEGHPQFKHPGYCECLGTGYYAPFEALRVVHNLVLVDEEHRTVRRAPCTEVGCPGWVPEPDIEKASARVHAAYPHQCFQREPMQELQGAWTWLKEQKP